MDAVLAPKPRTFHYYAMTFLPGGAIGHSDGIIKTPLDPANEADWALIRSVIALRTEPPSDPKVMNIASFTRLD
jgi:hypothetical protein